MKAEKKIPEALLRAECRMEELAELQAQGLAFLTRSRRVEIKKEVVARLMPNMPPTLTGIPFVFDQERDMVYAGCVSEKQMDAFTAAFRGTTGKAPIPLVPESAAMQRARKNARDLAPTSFTDALEDVLAGDSLGQDFLTWLWFFSERRGGTLETQHGTFAAAVEGPLTFVLEGEGAHIAMLKKGTPLVSAEAKTALLSGKKLLLATIVLALDERSWRFSLDAANFVVRGVKLPKGERLDPISQFQERMVCMGVMTDVLLSFFDTFIEERFDPRAWSATNAEMRRWISERVTRC